MSTIEKQKKIRELLKEKNAILLAHYYQADEIQDIADILGDSLALSIEAARTDADIIVFAGVHFMAESAAILSPDKTVLLPVIEAGCPLADKITASELNAAKEENPGAKVVAYVNSSARTKALSDICYTSANALNVVNSLTDVEKIIMVPDGNLARYAARLTEKEIIPWKGFCYVHDNLSPEAVRMVKEKHPKALFAAHLECRLEVLDLADFVGSTAAILKFARETDAGEIIVGTEKGIMHQLKKESPGKTFIPASESMVCQDMKKTSLDDILSSLVDMKHIIEVPEDVRIPAQRALKKMLEVS
jgi:quinolinate synthase